MRTGKSALVLIHDITIKTSEVSETSEVFFTIINLSRFRSSCCVPST